MKILVLGSSGMLGKYTTSYLSKKKYQVWTTTRKYLDAANISKEELKEKITVLDDNWGNEEKPDLIINCIGMIKPSMAKKPLSEGIKVNALFPHMVCEICKEENIKFIHVTTDCVYTGDLKPAVHGYDEDDIHDAEDDYGLTKFLGEPKDCTVIRTSIIGEEVDQSRSLIEWIKSQKNGKANGYLNHYWSGITCLQFAKIVERMIENDHWWIGTKHIHSNTVDKFELVEMINKSFNLNIEVTPVDGPQYCNRSLSSNFMDSEKLNPESLEKHIKELANYTDELYARD